jgi:hypothetical protein
MDDQQLRGYFTTQAISVKLFGESAASKYKQYTRISPVGAVPPPHSPGPNA